MIKKYNFFVSYSSKDASDVNKVMQQIKKRSDLNYFMDNKIKPGENWISALGNNILDSNVFLFFLRGRPGKWQLEELQIAIRQNVNEGIPKIIPVLLPNAEKDSFLNNPDLAFIVRNQAVQFTFSVYEINIIDSIIGIATNNEVTYVSNNSIPRPDKLPSGFKINIVKIAEVLIGESVYSSKDVCIRELIQNAQDACFRKIKNNGNTYRDNEILIKINNDSKYFDIIDYGDGMSKENLTKSFSILGLSVNEYVDEFDPNEKIIGKFGIGFVSSFMIAGKISVSTKAHNDYPYHFNIYSVDEPFEYLDESMCERNFDPIGKTIRCGTTIRVYLLSQFLSGSKAIDIESSVRKYCRHVVNLKIDNSENRYIWDSGWNFDSRLELGSVINNKKYVLHISWSTEENNTFIVSNGGIFVQELDFANMGIPRGVIAGEIDIKPGLFDLSIARDQIIKNKKFKKICDIIKESFYSLIFESLDYLRDVTNENELGVNDLFTVKTIKEKSLVAYFSIDDSWDKEILLELYSEAFIKNISIFGSKASNDHHTIDYVENLIKEHELKILLVGDESLNLIKKDHIINSEKSINTIAFDYITYRPEDYVVEKLSERKNIYKSEVINEYGIIKKCKIKNMFSIKYLGDVRDYYSLFYLRVWVFKYLKICPPPVFNRFNQNKELSYWLIFIIPILLIYIGLTVNDFFVLNKDINATSN